MIEGTDGKGKKEGKWNLEYGLGYQLATNGATKPSGKEDSW